MQAVDENRTNDLVLTKDVLYRLSYDSGKAGEGNRTLVISLEGCGSTIELHPPIWFSVFSDSFQ